MQDLIDRLATLAPAGLGRLVAVLVAIVILVVIYRIAMAAVRRVAARAAAPLPGEADLTEEQRAVRQAMRRRRLDTLVLFTTRLGRGVLLVTCVLLAGSVLVPELVSALGALGVTLGVAVGGAVGFGAQQLVRDYLNGMLILGENPFSVGDIVAVAGVRGVVEEVSLRRTIVRDIDGVLHSVPNGEIGVASNYTRTFARVNERLVVAVGTDIGRATGVLGDVCAELASSERWHARFLEAPRVVRVDAAATGEAGIPILVSAMVRPGEQWEVAGELRRRALEALRTAGIDMAAGRTLVVSRPSPPASLDEAEGDAEYT